MTMQSTTAGIVISPAALAQTLAPGIAAWVERERKISRATLERLGVVSGTAYCPDVGRTCDCLVFRYRDGWKARFLHQKAFTAKKGFRLSFWGEDDCLANVPETVYLVEGEFDRCALVEAGIEPRCVLSVPNGAKERTADDPKELRGYGYVQDALRAGLSRVKRFVWCGDNDGAGHALRADMARLLGAARFYFVEWPDGCKDANDMLRSDGPRDLRDRVTEGALQWPVEGLYRLSDLPEPPPFTLWQPGFQEWESKVLLAARTLSVVTGHPGHGKTMLFTEIWFRVVQAYHLVAFVASFETTPKPHLRKQLRTLFTGKLQNDMNDDERRRADAWISDHYWFGQHHSYAPTLEWFLDLAEVAVVRHGVKIVMLDPWNKLQGQRGPGEREDEYILRCLNTCYAFAKDMNCHVQIVAHPAKMHGERRGMPPELEDIAGAKHWENIVDQGFVVHRPEIFDGTKRRTEVSLYYRKARFEELGYQCKLELKFNLETGRYRSTDYDGVSQKGN